MKILNRLFLFCFLLLGGSGAFAQNKLPLSDIFSNLSGQSFADVESEARRQADRNPYYKSNAEEELVFEGYFEPTDSTAKLAILSDDGANVYVDGQSVHSGKGQGQHLPDLKQSLHQVSTSFKGGRAYLIRVEYSNIRLTSDTDVDGVTLFAYGSGGGVSDLDPRLKVAPHQRAVLPGDAIPVEVSVVDGGSESYDVTVEGPGQISPSTFSLTGDAMQTVMVTPPSETGEYDYQFSAVSQGSGAPQAEGGGSVARGLPAVGVGAVALGRVLAPHAAKLLVKARKAIFKPGPKPPAPRPRPKKKPKKPQPPKVVIVYRAVNATNPGSFVISPIRLGKDPGGMSVFEKIPQKGRRKFKVPFVVTYKGRKVIGKKGIVTAPVGAVAIYSPRAGGPGHWSLQMPGMSDSDFQKVLKAHAIATKIPDLANQTP